MGYMRWVLKDLHHWPPQHHALHLFSTVSPYPSVKINLDSRRSCVWLQQRQHKQPVHTTADSDGSMAHPCKGTSTWAHVQQYQQSCTLFFCKQQ